MLVKLIYFVLDLSITGNYSVTYSYVLSQNGKPKATTRRTKASVNMVVVGEIANAYEAYLIKKGYKTETDKGLPSTVYAYIKAISFVLDEENLSWSALIDKINVIVKKYDVGGEKEYLGNKSNKTVINALKRFQDYVNQL